MLRANGMRSDEKLFFCQIYVIFWEKWYMSWLTGMFLYLWRGLKVFLNPRLSLIVPLRLLFESVLTSTISRAKIQIAVVLVVYLSLCCESSGDQYLIQLMYALYVVMSVPMLPVLNEMIFLTLKMSMHALN